MLDFTVKHSVGDGLWFWYDVFVFFALICDMFGKNFKN